MKWNFWHRTPKEAERPEWPTDAYQSVKYLLGFYSMAGSLPFREWKSPLVDVKPTLENTAQISVRALQTRLYFWLLERRFGVPEAEIAKDGFLQLLTKLSDGNENDLGSMTRFLLELIDDAVNTAEKAGEKTIPTPNGDIVVPAEYFMALHLLMRMPDSPYYNSDTNPEFNRDDWALAECLVHGKDAAKEFFTPMIQAVTNFDVTQFPEWSWRKKLGAHERHLQRRHNNLLFPAPRRVVTTADILDARRKDDAEFRELREKVKAIELPEKLPRNWSDFLAQVREQIDELKKRTRQIGGDTTKIMDFLNNTRSNMADVWRACNKGNAEALRLYEIAEAAAREYDHTFRGDFGNQLLRDDTCIPREEIVPALLSENAGTVAAFYERLGDPERATAKQWVAQIVMDAAKEGFDITSIKEQLYAMGWPHSTVA
jgi:hypothetical protein